MDDIGSPTSADVAFDMMENFSKKIRNTAVSADELLQLRQKLGTLKQFYTEHPIAGLFLLVLLVMAIIPVVCFVIFAICTTLTLIASFMFFEAFCLTAGAFILIGVLSFFAFISVGFTALLSIAYYTVVSLSKLAGNLRRSIAPRMPAPTANSVRHRAD